ncbi:MAG TPA: DNA glycosylase [bacterium]|nr:DNA glycosylase [bacterium]
MMAANPGTRVLTAGRERIDLGLSLECGQVFGWHKHNGAYIGIIRGCPVVLRQAGEAVEYVAGGGLPAEAISHYLGLDEELQPILESVAVDGFMKKVLKSVKGLRLLKQEPWHCLCSYLLSSSNRVERIDKTVKEIARRWGTSHSICGYEVHTLPEPDVLAACGEPGIRSCGAGFRSPYLVRAAAKVANGTLDFASLGRLPYQEAKEVLMTIDGVGEKIADCILLFAFSRYEAFPVDVWIKKAVERIYFGGEPVSPKEIRRFAREHFGPYAGYAQEYIYHYARSRGLEGEP